MKKKLAIFLSHPIQYFAPLFKYIHENSESIDLTVYYFSDISLKKYQDRDFKKEIKWDIDLLDGYNYKFIKNLHNEKTPNNFFSLINFGVFKEIKNNDYDLVLTFGWSTLSNLFVLFASLWYCTPYAIRGESPYMYEKKKKGIKKYIRKAFLSSIFDNASALFYIGTQNKHFYQKEFNVREDKLFFTPYSINNDFFINEIKDIDIDEEKKKLQIDKGQKVLLFSGKLIERKEPKLLLESLKDIYKSKYCLVFLGSGVLEEELKQYSKQNDINAKFLGFVNQSEIPKYYKLSDIFILPSTYETWGLVVNEAMCCKNIIISSTTVGSSYDLIKNGENGYIFNSGDSVDLKEKIEKLLNYSDEDLNRAKEKSFEMMRDWNYRKIMNGFEESLKDGRS